MYAYIMDKRLDGYKGCLREKEEDCFQTCSR